MTSPVLSLPAAPASAVAVFGDRLALAERYARLLAGAGVERGLLGPRETPRLWERHLWNCAGLTELLEPAEHVVDVGSGAGLPGLVLAIRRPDLQVELVEPLLRRATFLTEAVEELGLTNASVRRGRAEELAGRLTADVVTARAVVPLDRLVSWTMPLLRTGGRLLALKGATAEAELAAGRPGLRRAGADAAEVVEVGSDPDGAAGRGVVVGGRAGGGRRARAGGSSPRRRTQGGAAMTELGWPEDRPEGGPDAPLGWPEQADADSALPPPVAGPSEPARAGEVETAKVALPTLPAVPSGPAVPDYRPIDLSTDPLPVVRLDEPIERIRAVLANDEAVPHTTVTGLDEDTPIGIAAAAAVRVLNPGGRDDFPK